MANRSDTTATAANAGKFKVTLRNTAYSGELHGITFKDGVGETDDGKRAHACLELGATVTKDGKPAWPAEPEQDPAAAAAKK